MTFAKRKAIIVLAYDYELGIELIKTYASLQVYVDMGFFTRQADMQVTFI